MSDRELFILRGKPESMRDILHQAHPDRSYDRGLCVWVEQLGCSTQTMPAYSSVCHTAHLSSTHTDSMHWNETFIGRYQEYQLSQCSVPRFQ